jgi:glutaredoxin 3
MPTRRHSPSPTEASTVVLFTAPSCPWCERTKQYLAEHQVTYTEVDVSQDEDAAIRMLRKSRQLGVPQVWVGEEVVVGFNQDRLDTLLNGKP